MIGHPFVRGGSIPDYIRTVGAPSIAVGVSFDFNAGDAWSDVDVWYTVPADTTSLLDRTLYQDDRD